VLLEVSGFSPDDPEVDDPSELPLVSLLVLVSSTPMVVAAEAAPELPVLVSPDPVELPPCIEVDVVVPPFAEVVVGRAGEVLPSAPEVSSASPVVLVLV
jgi:hypothetical protein